jgi:DNA-binding MarR family transcriptional regulator
MACVRSNITQLIDRMQAEGLVRRIPDPQDRRSVRAALTD